MQIHPVHCPSCQAIVNVPVEMDRVQCEYCGTVSIIEHSNGRVSLKLAEEIAGLKQSLQDSTHVTTEHIRTSSENTQREIQHLRLTQELTLVETRLAGIQTDIDLLERNTDKKAKKVVSSQLATKRQEAAELATRRGRINNSIAALYSVAEPVPAPEIVEEAPNTKAKGKGRGCLIWFGVWFLIHLAYGMFFTVAIDDPVTLPLIFSLATVGIIYYRRRKRAVA